MNYRRPAKCCCRCRRTMNHGQNWPEGFVCASCVRHGVLRHGRCPGCGANRALPGFDADRQPICVDCAGIPTSFRCSTCGIEDEAFYAHTCLRCSLKRRLAGLLDDGSGQVAPSLVPLFEALGSMPEPRRGLKWLNSAAVRERLAAIATGAVALTHAGLDTFDANNGREYLRELLMAHGCLAAQDKYLMAFERWETRRLATIDDPADRQTIRVYLRWRHHRELTARAASGPLTALHIMTARNHTNSGLRLLSWLRERNVTLAECTQADLDAWFATVTNAVRATDFLRWAMRHQRCPRLVFPVSQRRSTAAAPESHRLELLARLLVDVQIVLGDRVAGCLILLLAQPITRVCALRIDDIDEHKGEVRLRLGDDPVVLPDAVGKLVTTLAGHRPHMLSAANVESPWLFPGHFPGHHISPTYMSHRMTAIGVTRLDRQAALRQLVREIPGAMVAKALGFSPTTTARHASDLGIDWSAYAGIKARQTSSSS
jgi:integrase